MEFNHWFGENLKKIKCLFSGGSFVFDTINSIGIFLLLENSKSQCS